MFINPVIGKINNLYSYNMNESKPKPQLQAKSRQSNSAINFGRMPMTLSNSEIEQINRFAQACKNEIKRWAELSGQKGYVEKRNTYVLGKKVDLFFNNADKSIYPFFQGYLIKTGDEMILLDSELRIYARLLTEGKKITMQRFAFKEEGKSAEPAGEYCRNSMEFDPFTLFLTEKKPKQNNLT